MSVLGDFFRYLIWLFVNSLPDDTWEIEENGITNSFDKAMRKRDTSGMQLHKAEQKDSEA